MSEKGTVSGLTHELSKVSSVRADPWRNHRSALPWLAFGDVGSAEEFHYGELQPFWGGQEGMAIYPGCLHPWNAGKSNLPNSGS